MDDSNEKLRKRIDEILLKLSENGAASSETRFVRGGAKKIKKKSKGEPLQTRRSDRASRTLPWGAEPHYKLSGFQDVLASQENDVSRLAAIKRNPKKSKKKANEELLKLLENPKYADLQNKLIRKVAKRDLELKYSKRMPHMYDRGLSFDELVELRKKELSRPVVNALPLVDVYDPTGRQLPRKLPDYLDIEKREIEKIRKEIEKDEKLKQKERELEAKKLLQEKTLNIESQLSKKELELEKKLQERELEAHKKLYEEELKRRQAKLQKEIEKQKRKYAEEKAPGMTAEKLIRMQQEYRDLIKKTEGVSERFDASEPKDSDIQRLIDIYDRLNELKIEFDALGVPYDQSYIEYPMDVLKRMSISDYNRVMFGNGMKRNPAKRKQTDAQKEWNKLVKDVKKKMEKKGGGKIPMYMASKEASRLKKLQTIL